MDPGLSYHTFDIDLEKMFIQKAWHPHLPDHIVGCTIQRSWSRNPLAAIFANKKSLIASSPLCATLGWPTHSLLELVDLLLSTAAQQKRNRIPSLGILWGRNSLKKCLLPSSDPVLPQRLLQKTAMRWICCYAALSAIDNSRYGNLTSLSTHSKRDFPLRILPS